MPMFFSCNTNNIPPNEKEPDPIIEQSKTKEEQLEIVKNTLWQLAAYIDGETVTSPNPEYYGNCVTLVFNDKGDAKLRIPWGSNLNLKFSEEQFLPASDDNWASWLTYGEHFQLSEKIFWNAVPNMESFKFEDTEVKLFCKDEAYFLFTPISPNMMPTWSYAGAYVKFLNQLKCHGDSITLYNEGVGQYVIYDDTSAVKITGTWKLLVYFSQEDTIDYSCKSVFYSFENNGKVTIHSDASNIQSKKCEFYYTTDPFMMGCPNEESAYPPPNLIIEKDSIFCQVARDWLVLRNLEYLPNGTVVTTNVTIFNKQEL
jgi:hypothetical protein